MRTRSKKNAQPHDDPQNSQDSNHLDTESQVVTKLVPKKRKLIATNGPKKVLSVVLKRLTTEELMKYGISSTKKVYDKPTRQPKNRHANVNAKTKRGGRKSMKIQLRERMMNEVPVKEFLIDEVILATVPGFVPWPARILNITGQTIMIEFFGTGHM